MSQKKIRRRFTVEKKAKILRKVLFEKKTISELCDQYGLQPSVLYQWQR